MEIRITIIYDSIIPVFPRVFSHFQEKCEEKNYYLISFIIYLLYIYSASCAYVKTFFCCCRVL